MKFPQFMSFICLVIALQLLSVTALPIDAGLPGAGNFLPEKNGVVVEKTQYGDERKTRRSVPPINTESFTAGDFIYHTYEQLSPDLYSWLFEMDIVKSSRTVKTVLENNGLLEPEHQGIKQRERKAASVLSDYLWPNGRIPYVFDSIMSRNGRTAALEGMEYWMKYTCLKFVPKEEDDLDYIQFAERDGCWSYVGIQGGVQLISLGSAPRSFCKFPGVVLHELGHAIGLWHEQSRYDRDEYIDIIWENIEPDAYSSFYKYKVPEIETFSLPYDYGSIMHYSEQSFSINGLPTILARDPDVKVMGQRLSLSPLDIKLVNLLYGCAVTNSSSSNYSTDSKSFNIPQDAFLIVNSETHACLDVSNRTTDWIAPIMDQHDFLGIYYVALTECHPTNRDQFWKWTKDGSLLHLGTYMCLTALDSNVPILAIDPDLLVLMHCRSGYGRQHWVCAENFVENPNLGKCVSAVADTPGRDKRNTENRDETISELDHELKTFVSGQLPTMPTKVIQKFHIFFEHPKLSNYSAMASLDYCQQTEISQTWNSVYYEDNCIQLGSSLCSLDTDESHYLPACYNKDMTESTGLQFFYASWLGCDELGYYASGFYHTDQISGNGASAVLTGIECCPSGSIFTGRADNPPAVVEEECADIEWWNWQETLISEGWFSCPRGMFLKSFLITIRPFALGHYIWKVKCCKPSSSSLVYEHCYKDYGGVSKDTSVHRCTLEGYHVTGMYKKCNKVGEDCVEEIMCCMGLGV